MKNKLISGLAVAFLVILNSQLSSLQAQGTTFTYQGRLNVGGVPYTGNAAFVPTLWDSATNGTLVAGNSPSGSTVTVTNGLFALSLNFGDNFPGLARWLQLDVSTNGEPSTTLAPRQRITPTPYAITASSFTGFLGGDVSGTQGASVISSVGGQSAAMVAIGVDAANGASSANSPNTIVKRDGSGNFAAGAITAASLSGGGAGLTGVNAAALGGLSSANFWQLGGNNIFPGQFLGSTNNQPLELRANSQRVLRLEPNANEAPNLIGGSSVNLVGAGAVGVTIAGGGTPLYDGAANINYVLSDFGSVGGGLGNTLEASSIAATVAGGYANTIGNNANSGVIGGGEKNSIADNSGYASIAGGLKNKIGNNSGYGVIGGGEFNNIAANSTDATIAGGAANSIGTNAHLSAIGGGSGNKIASNSQSAAIAGGDQNDIGSDSNASLIGGGIDNDIGDNSVYATIGGGALNDIGTNSHGSVIGGGYDNNVAGLSLYATIGGGFFNAINMSANASTIGGGELNNIASHSEDSTVAGGGHNDIGNNSAASTVGGGFDNNIGDYSEAATISGGSLNNIGTNSSSSAIGGGFDNRITHNASSAVIPGGRENIATNYAFAAGRRAKAIHSGSFVWGDSFNGDVTSSTNNQFTARASGGVRFFSNVGQIAGVILAAGGTSWAVISDRNAKKDFAAVDSMAILEKLAAMPITQWHYQWETPEVTPHIGPMAQDFKAAFYPGSDDKSITTQEADGVALAAIQGLNQKVEAKNTEIADLKARLEKLERLLSQNSDGAK